MKILIKEVNEDDRETVFHLVKKSSRLRVLACMESITHTGGVGAVVLCMNVIKSSQCSVAHEETLMSPLLFCKYQGPEDLIDNPRYDTHMVPFHNIGSKY